MIGETSLWHLCWVGYTLLILAWVLLESTASGKSLLSCNSFGEDISGKRNCGSERKTGKVEKVGQGWACHHSVQGGSVLLWSTEELCRMHSESSTELMEERRMCSLTSFPIGQDLPMGVASLYMFRAAQTWVLREFLWTSHSEVSGKTWGRKQEIGGIEKLHLWEADVAVMSGMESWKTHIAGHKGDLTQAITYCSHAYHYDCSISRFLRAISFPEPEPCSMHSP